MWGARQIMSPPKSFQVVAHRGTRVLDDRHAMAPANTMPAFHEAAKRGAAIELDVLATRDGRLVIHHDFETGHLFNQPTGDKAITASSWAELQAARLNVSAHEADVAAMLGGSEAPDYRLNPQYVDVCLPELKDVVLGLPQTYFYIELKTKNEQVRRDQTNQLEERVVEFIREHDLYDRVSVISFSTASLRKVKQLDPRIKTGLDFKLPDALKKADPLIGLFVGGFAKRYLGVDSIHCRYQDASPRLVQAAHKNGMQIMPWVAGQTVAEEEVFFPKLMAMGVDGLITNAIDRLNATVTNQKP